jgi:hypothetical protein
MTEDKKKVARALFTIYALITVDYKKVIESIYEGESEDVIKEYRPNILQHERDFEDLIYREFGLIPMGEPGYKEEQDAGFAYLSDFFEEQTKKYANESI